MTIRLLIAPAGTGKTHWLQKQNQIASMIDCTHPSHRQILINIASQLGLETDTRAQISDIIALIAAAPPAQIALDNIDRAAPRLMFSILEISKKHEIAATATRRDKCAALLDRAAAEIVELPKPNLREIVTAVAPTLTPAQIRTALSHATTPAQATNAARAIAAGKTPPTPKTINLFPVIVLAFIFILYILRYEHITPVFTALAAVALFLVRRFFKIDTPK